MTTYSSLLTTSVCIVPHAFGENGTPALTWCGNPRHTGIIFTKTDTLRRNDVACQLIGEMNVIMVLGYPFKHVAVSAFLSVRRLSCFKSKSYISCEGPVLCFSPVLAHMLASEAAFLSAADWLANDLFKPHFL